MAVVPSHHLLHVMPQVSFGCTTMYEITVETSENHYKMWEA
jgi:hypothetical protein